MSPTFTHLWLLVEDIPRSLDFYQNTLGLTLTSDLGVYAEFSIDDNFFLALFQRSAMQAGEPTIAISPVSGQRTTLALEVKAFDAFCAQLRQLGVTFISEVTIHPEWGLRTIFLHDPDGNLICLYGDPDASGDQARSPTA